jgi:hypothetical protein
MARTIDKRISGSSHGHKYARTQVHVKKNVNRKEAEKKSKVIAHQKMGRKIEKTKKKMQDMQLEKMKRQKKMEEKLGRPLSTLQSSKKKEDPNEEWEDVDEHEKDVFDKDGYYDVMDEDQGISMNDLKLLEKFNPAAPKQKSTDLGPSEGVNFADLICAKLEAGDYVDGNDYEKHMQGRADDMDPKIVSTY